MLIGIISILIIILLVFMYLKLKHPFWFIQPVNHRFNMFYWGRSGEIRKDLPKKNKYCNFQIKFSDSENVKWKEVADFISCHFLKNENNTYNPTINEIKPYFKKMQ